MKTISVSSCRIAMILVVILTFFITKQIYDQELPELKKPETEVVKNEIEFPEVTGEAKLKKEKIPVKREVVHRDTGQVDTVYLVLSDSTANDSTSVIEVETASLDTTLLLQHEEVFPDTTIKTTTTLKLKVKYLYPPLNKFIIKSGLTTYSYHRTEFQPQYIEKKENIFDKISLGIGFGYATHFEEVKFKPAIFVGIYYRVDIF